MSGRRLIAAAVALQAACGSTSSPLAPTTPPGTASPAPAEPPTITIAATGFTPQEITVAVGSRVIFVNSDRIGHEIASGIDHNARECPEIDAVGFLVAGQRVETPAFAQTKTCRFHDHAYLGVAAYQGLIVVR